MRSAPRLKTVIVPLASVATIAVSVALRSTPASVSLLCRTRTTSDWMASPVSAATTRKSSALRQDVTG